MKIGTAVLVLILALVFLGFLGATSMNMHSEIVVLREQNHILGQRVEFLEEDLASVTEERDMLHVANESLSTSFDEVSNENIVLREVLAATLTENEGLHQLLGQTTLKTACEPFMGPPISSNTNKGHQLASVHFQTSLVLLAGVAGFAWVGLGKWSRHSRAKTRGHRRLLKSGEGDSVSVKMSRQQLAEFIHWRRKLIDLSTGQEHRKDN